MDDQAYLKTYGNRNLPEGTDDRPLVTFAVFAYNQEKYIREAVQGAFSQTYSPLEIILSDDCSSDRTFEIMEEMAREYRESHRVVVRRNTFNIGTALHLQSVFQVSNGVLFVVAAGDDISIPDRVAQLIETWMVAGQPEGLLHSGRELFRDDKIVAQVPANGTRFLATPVEGYARSFWLPAAAPTCAYTRGVFQRFGPLLGGSIIEDAPLQFRAAILGSLLCCERPLVRQRLHDNNTGSGYRVDNPMRWNRFILSKMIAFRTMQSDLMRWQDATDADMKCRIEARLLAVIGSASGLILPEGRTLTILEQLQLALKMLAAPAIARSFRLRLEYTLSFFGFRVHLELKDRLRPFLSKRKSL